MSPLYFIWHVGSHRPLWFFLAIFFLAIHSRISPTGKIGLGVVQHSSFCRKSCVGLDESVCKKPAQFFFIITQQNSVNFNQLRIMIKFAIQSFMFFLFIN